MVIYTTYDAIATLSVVIIITAEPEEMKQLKMVVPNVCSPSTVLSTPTHNSTSDQSRHSLLLERNCATMKDLQQLHAHFIKTGQATKASTAGRLLAFCASPTGNLDYAYLLFMRIQRPNLFAWNTIIRGFSQSSNPQVSISLFIDMLDSPVQPQKLTYPSVFKAYTQLGLARDGAPLHGRIVKLGLQGDRFVRNTILHMYASCGFLDEGRQIFNQYLEFDIVAWNSMIMDLAKCGKISESKSRFDQMPVRNSLSWNSMISGYVRNWKLREAMELFREMLEEGVEASEFTMVSLLNASANLGALSHGEWIHDYISKNNLKFNVIVTTSIIDMYCKCGCIEKAIQVFESAPKKGLSNWNSMMFGLATNSRETEAIKLFDRLEGSNFKPDDISFLSVLTACNHSKMVDRAQYYFSLMTETYKIKPSIKHYSCMVDVLGQEGLLDEAEEVIRRMPMKPDTFIWGSLLSSCRKQGNIEMAKRAAEHMIKSDSKESCGYVLLSNVYAAGQRFEEAIEQRARMTVRQIKKEPGSSLIESDGEIHEFISGGRKHPRAREIYLLLNGLG